MVKNLLAVLRRGACCWHVEFPAGGEQLTDLEGLRNRHLVWFGPREQTANGRLY